MRPVVCDFCKSLIHDDSPVFITIIVSNFMPNDQPAYRVDAEVTKLDCCTTCGAKKGLVVDSSKHTIEPGTGALTPDDLKGLGL